jgi:hypothetical protein
MEALSVASRKTPQAAGGPNDSNNLFYIGPKTGPFFESLGNLALERLPVLYWRGSRRNGLGSLLRIVRLLTAESVAL